MPRLSNWFTFRKDEITPPPPPPTAPTPPVPVSPPITAEDRETSFHTKEEEEEEDEGDCILISSDGKRFPMQSYHLKSHSPVFRDMISIPAPSTPTDETNLKPEIKLCDDHLESSRIISIFCQSINGEALAPPKDEEHLKRHFDVQPFLIKNEMTMILEVLKSALYRWYAAGTTGMSTGILFRHACAMDDLDLMVVVIKGIGDKRWVHGRNEKEVTEAIKSGATPSPEHLCDGLTGYDVLNPLGMDYATFTSIPSMYTFSLMRAFVMVMPPGQKQATKDPWEQVGDKFREVVQSIKDKGA